MRLATEQDGEFLRRLYFDVHAQEFEPLGLPPFALEQLLDMQFRAQSVGYITQYPSATNHLVLLRGEPVGRLLREMDLDALHLIDIALLSAVRGQGIGHHLLTIVDRQADLPGLPIQLHVRVGNPAIHLYLRHGFIPCGGDTMNIAMRRPPRGN